MAKTDFKSVDEYIASRPEAVQDTLERVRNTIRKAVPQAREVISYQIPGYKMPGGPVLYFAGWKEHYSLYPATAPVIAEFTKELGAHEIRNHTIRFRLSEPVPVRLIERIAKSRAKEIGALEKAKAAKAGKNRSRA
jgi:uncharacterized protein YdhG (YjbR/CyaY superfamily)